jgi:hypothetical protein
MIDVMTQAPLRIEGEKINRPYLSLPDSQLEEVQRILERNGVR